MKEKLLRIGAGSLLAVLAFACTNACAESFGINYVGSAPNSVVTSSAGIEPIATWNNINVLTNGVNVPRTIVSGDGTQAATLTIFGNTNAVWHTGVANDGGNGSLMDGYLDLGANRGGPLTNVIGGLTGAIYKVYIYNMADAPRSREWHTWSVRAQEHSRRGSNTPIQT